MVSVAGVTAIVVRGAGVGATVGAAVLGADVVVTMTEPQPTAGKTKSLHVGSLGWKHREPSAREYIPKQTGMVCQSLQ